MRSLLARWTRFGVPLAVGSLVLIGPRARAQFVPINPCTYPPDTAAFNLLPVDCGESVVTTFSGEDGVNALGSGAVVRIVDIRNPNNGSFRNFCPPMWRNMVPSTANPGDRW